MKFTSSIAHRARNPIALWVAFILVHLWLGWLNLTADGMPLGDVTLVYRYWTDQVRAADFWVGIDAEWVYPILAIFPMLAVTLFGPENNEGAWLTLVMLLNAAAFAAIIGWRAPARRPLAAWWWLGFLVLLGPISMGRIDAITIPLAIIGLLIALKHPLAATLLFTVGAWMKVWPAALVGALVVTLRDRWRILATAIGFSAAIIGLALLYGSGANVLSFLWQHTGRGLQVEAVVTTPSLWQAFAGQPDTEVYYSHDILTYQVSGAGVEVLSALMTPLLVLAVLAVTLTAALAVSRGAQPTDLLAPLSLALVTALIVFNKVGSPQIMSWLAPPVILGLALSARAAGRSFGIPAILSLAIAALTQVIYPYLYGWLLALDPAMLAAITVRNAMLIVLFGWSVTVLVRLAAGPPRPFRSAAPGATAADDRSGRGSLDATRG